MKIVFSSMIIRMLTTIAAFVLLPTVHIAAQNHYCYDVGSKDNPEYPEMDSKCTVVNQGPNSTTISAVFQGPQLPAKNTDPVCGSIEVNVSCRRICGDLPKGKKPGQIVSRSISPPSFARFDMFESFNKGDHYRVCYRVKNWANAGFNRGENRTFTFTIGYKSQQDDKK